MPKVLFIDDRPDEVLQQWSGSGVWGLYTLLPCDPFVSTVKTAQDVKSLQPDIIIVGFGLGVSGTTGADVVRHLRSKGFTGYVFSNTGGSDELFLKAGIRVDGNLRRSPMLLCMTLLHLCEE